MANTYVRHERLPAVPQADPAYDERQRKLARLRQISGLQEQYPGRRPGGTGKTGLASTDARGWSDMLNQQTEAANIERELSGKGPLQVRSGYQLGGMAPSIADSPDWWLQGEPDHRELNTQTIPRIRRNLDMLPPSLRSLYAERFNEK